MRPSSLVLSLISFAVHVCAIVSRETEKERYFSRTTYVQNGVPLSGTMGLRAIIGFATANRLRIIPPRTLAYSLEDLFRHAHNRIGMPLEGTLALLLLRGKSRMLPRFSNWHSRLLNELTSFFATSKNNNNNDSMMKSYDKSQAAIVDYLQLKVMYQVYNRIF